MPEHPQLAVLGSTHGRNRGPVTPHGFTLIELIIVVVMIGVLTGIALPQFNLGRIRVDGAIQGLGSTVLAAQRIAIGRQHDVIVRFDVSGNAIFIHEDANSDGFVGGVERVRRIPLGEAVTFGRGGVATHPLVGANVVSFTRMAEGVPAVTFHRNGSASEAGGFYITSRREIANGQNPTDGRVMEIARPTGRVSWWRYSPTGWQRTY